MKVEKVKICDLKPLEKNVRKHNDTQINELIRSLEQFGQTRAIVVDEDNNIMIGNGLYFAMKKHGDEVADCYRKVGLSEKEKKKLILSDNKIFSLGVDNFDAVNDFINEIASDGDFDIAGFDEEIIKRMTASFAEVEEEINSYGIVETPKPTPLHTVESAPVANEEASATKIETPAPTPAPATQPERKAIICPSCGEVIYID